MVRREGYANDIWLTENGIENVDVVKNYQQKVLNESGYSITESDNNGTNSEVLGLDVSENQQQHQQEVSDLSNKRPSRISKTRAVMALKQPEFMDEGDEDRSRGKKRKSAANKDGSHAGASSGKKRSNGNGTGRKTKVQVLLEKQLEDRLERKNERENKDDEAIIRSMDNTERKDCCLKCASNLYRHLLEKGDLEEFKKCFQDVRNIPNHDQEDAPNGLHLIPYAIVLEKFDFAEFATKFVLDPNTVRPAVPTKYVTYEDDTGHNRGFGAYGNRAFR